MPLNLTKINCITLKIRSKAEFMNKSQNIWQQIITVVTVMQMICAWPKIWTLSGRLYNGCVRFVFKLSPFWNPSWQKLTFIFLKLSSPWQWYVYYFNSANFLTNFIRRSLSMFKYDKYITNSLIITTYINKTYQHKNKCLLLSARFPKGR
jgi:hypothetical protein